MYACQNEECRQRSRPGANTRRDQSQIHHPRKGKASSQPSACCRARLETHGGTGTGCHCQASDGFVAAVPYPGSPGAIAKGCCCPILDNYIRLGSGKSPGTWICHADCPIHGCCKKVGCTSAPSVVKRKGDKWNSPAVRQKRKIGKQIADQLPQLATSGQVARYLGISRQAVEKIEQLALYKLRVRLIEEHEKLINEK